MMNSRKKYKLKADSTKGPGESIHKQYEQTDLKYRNVTDYFSTDLFMSRSKFLTILVAGLPERFAL